MNKDGFDPSTLQLSYWNDMISLRITPALDPSKQTETKVFDYEKTVVTAINLEKAMLIVKAIKDSIFPAIEAGENKDIAFSINGDSLLAFGTGKRLTGEIRPFIAIHKSLNPDTKKPEMSIFYEFKRNQFIDDYNEATGSYSLVNNVHAELNVFYKCVIASIFALTNANTHSQRHVNKFANDRLNSNVIAIAETVGANVSTYGGGSKSFNRTNTIDFGSNSSSATRTTTPSVSTESINSLEEFEKMLQN